MLHKLRNELGLNVRAFDRAGGVGGTWYWNRYPGALSDTESFVYRYSFDDELLNEWDWTHKYVTQPEILKYLEHVVDRYDLRKDIQLNTGITSARYDESADRWVIGTDTGETITAKYIVNGLGLLSATNVPNIPGIDTFEGKIYHSGAWPEGVDLTGKRVGVIGTGSTGLQIITAIAPKVGHLTVFQRSPQYSVPVGNTTVTPEYVASVKKDYGKIWEQVRASGVAFGFEESTVPAMSVSEAERQAVFQKAWETAADSASCSTPSATSPRTGTPTKLPHRLSAARSPRSSRTRRRPASSRRPTSTPSAPCATAATTPRSTGTTSSWYR